jgi:hypothetical protein
MQSFKSFVTSDNCSVSVDSFIAFILEISFLLNEMSISGYNPFSFKVLP